MNALEEIIGKLTDDGESLAGPLLKTKVLASRIKNQEILDWATRELEGYRGVMELPAYRYVRAVYEWVVRQRGAEIPKAPVSQMLFDEETRLLYFRGRMDGAVKVLESMTKRNDGDGFIGKEYAPDICQFLTKKILRNDKLNIVILRLICTIDISEAVQVLAAIRSKLLDFILRLEAEVPELAKPLSQISPIEGVGQSTITQIFHNTVITVTGNANTVVTGDSNDTSYY